MHPPRGQPHVPARGEVELRTGRVPDDDQAARRGSTSRAKACSWESPRGRRPRARAIGAPGQRTSQRTRPASPQPRRARASRLAIPPRYGAGPRRGLVSAGRREQAGPMQTPTTVVLFGATGDLARRKLLPGLLHLFEAGLLPELRVVGTSLDEHDRESFVELARAGRRASTAARDPTRTAGTSSPSGCTGRPAAGGAEALRTTVAEAEAELRIAASCAGCTTSASRPRRRSSVVHLLERGRPRRAQPDHHGEAVRHRPRVRARR